MNKNLTDEEYASVKNEAYRILKENSEILQSIDNIRLFAEINNPVKGNKEAEMIFKYTMLYPNDTDFVENIFPGMKEREGKATEEDKKKINQFILPSKYFEHLTYDYMAMVREGKIIPLNQENKKEELTLKEKMMLASKNLTEAVAKINRSQEKDKIKTDLIEILWPTEESDVKSK